MVEELIHKRISKMCLKQLNQYVRLSAGPIQNSMHNPLQNHNDTHGWSILGHDVVGEINDISGWNPPMHNPDGIKAHPVILYQQGDLKTFVFSSIASAFTYFGDHELAKEIIEWSKNG